MPLNPKASFIADPSRAAQLFPPQPCRQCNGSTKVQRYKEIECSTCKGTTRAGDVPCPDCYSNTLKVSTGKRMVPETIPCPGCGGQGKKSRVHDTRPETLAAAKPADWVVIGVEFPAMPIEDLKDSKYSGASAELVSCMVMKKDAATTRIMVRVLQSPEYSDAHGLRYGDLLELGPNHILVHTQCTQEEFEKARDGGLFNFAPQVPIAPQRGRGYITRGGAKAVVWSFRVDDTGQFAIGSVNGIDTEWNMDGTERKGVRAGDLVQFTEVVNA